MIFESLPHTPSAEELIDKAFSRAARAGRGQDGIAAQEVMVRTAGNILADNLQHLTAGWPDFDRIHPFYAELAGTLVNVDSVRQSLGEISWAGTKCAELRGEYRERVQGGNPDTARKHRKQAFARFADIVDSVDADLTVIREAREELRRLPDIKPEEPAIVVAGYPNVGKSSFVRALTNADAPVASYPFTTTGVLVGHLDRDHVRYQLIDTPGILDRPDAERNEIEGQALSAITHAADCVLFLLDASEQCGYPLADQLALRDELADRFAPTPLVTVCNKADASESVAADYYMSVTEERNVEAVLNAAIETIGYEPELPFESDA